MRKRMLGKTGIEVSEVGFSTRQLGNDKEGRQMNEEEAIRLIHEAHMNGCFFFDTSPDYEKGKHEELLGKALKDIREEVVISSKSAYNGDDVQSSGSDDLITTVENSLKRLNTDYLDILLLDKPAMSVIDKQSSEFQALEKLKNQGKIRAYGVSVDTGEKVNHIIDNTDSQIIEVRFNVFHQEPLNEISRAYNEDIGIIITAPLDSGWLTGKYDVNSSFDSARSRWSREDIKRRSALVKEVRKIIGEDVSMTQMALEYILAYKEVSTVIPGSRNSEQLLHNLSASQHLLSKETVNDLKGLWIEEIKGRPLSW